MPNAYFKLDPEFNSPGANTNEVIAHLNLQKHAPSDPAVARFPLYRVGLKFEAVPFLGVKVTRGAWHLIDARPPDRRYSPTEKPGLALAIDLLLVPPVSAALTLLLALLGSMEVIVLTVVLAAFLRRWVDLALNHSPPLDESLLYPHVGYCSNQDPTPRWERSIAFTRVVDIGVGHVHLHQQYDRTTGGELQVLRISPTDGPWKDHLALYQLFNGPIVDADGFNDGTCNYYSLVKLNNGRFALLYLDEQSFFSSRWRLADRDDCKGTFLASLTADLVVEPDRHDWVRANYWSPFDEPGLISESSRLAVSAQVVLLTGDLPAKLSPAPLIFSTNFSWGTMDRTWRWRSLPPNAKCRVGDPDEANDAGTTVYPQSVRLRDDMTIHLKGTRDGVPGRWYQRYLPASNELVPNAHNIAPGRPACGDFHPWKFIAKQAFQFADRYSHFGVYEQVDSRMLYYPVVLEAGNPPGPEEWWASDGNALSVDAYLVRLETLQSPWPPWSAEMWVKHPMQPPSQYNPAVYLKIVKRGSRWIAIRADKRDDDAAGLGNLPWEGTLTTARRGLVPPSSVKVRLDPSIKLSEPPAVQTAFSWWDTPTVAAIAFTPPLNGQRVGENVCEIRMAAFDDAGAIIPLLNVTMDNPSVVYDDKARVYQYRWTPTDGDRQHLVTYANNKGSMQHGTSIWFKDLTGHVAPPDQIRWNKPPELVPATGSDMQPGEILKPNGSITSANRRYSFIYQDDGNLVLYDNAAGRRPLWPSNTAGTPVGVCIMQDDGNLAIYANINELIWSSNACQYPGSHLVVQDDGNVVIYRPDRAVVWSTGTWISQGPAAQGDNMQPGQVLGPNQSITSANRRYTFIYQDDGNLVLYDNAAGRKPLWPSNTAGTPVGVCIMQSGGDLDGNLVIYSHGGNRIWSSTTGQHPGSYLIVQDDGNVVTTARTARWSGQRARGFRKAPLPRVTICSQGRCLDPTNRLPPQTAGTLSSIKTTVTWCFTIMPLVVSLFGLQTRPERPLVFASCRAEATSMAT